jgi:hypothetical protein
VRRTINRGTWETRPSGCGTQRRRGNHNLLHGSDRESAGFIVARKRGNARGAKGPCQIRAGVRRREGRLEETPTTDTCGPGRRTSLLRQQLSQKVKQGGEPPCACRWQRYLGTPDAGNPHVRCDEGRGRLRHGLRVVSHVRGNPETEVYRSLNQALPLLLYVIFLGFFAHFSPDPPTYTFRNYGRRSKPRFRCF